MKNIIAIGSIVRMSFSRRSHETNTRFGKIRLCGYRYAFGKMVKMYSVSNSATIHNGGGYTLNGLICRILGK